MGEMLLPERVQNMAGFKASDMSWDSPPFKMTNSAGLYSL